MKWIIIAIVLILMTTAAFAYRLRIDLSINLGVERTSPGADTPTSIWNPVGAFIVNPDDENIDLN